MWARLRSFVGGLTRRGRVEHDLAEELEFHVQARAEHWERQGLSAAEAARKARLEFGAMEGYKERCRQARGLRLIDELRGDLGYALRQMRAAPMFTAIAVGILAIAIGANTAVFSVVEAVLWRMLPVERPQELRELAWTAHKDGFSGRYNGSMRPYPGGGLIATSFAYPVYAHVRDNSTAFTDLFLFDRNDRINIGVAGQAHVVPGLLVSGNFFRGLGVEMAIGRPIVPEDDRAGTPPVAVLSYRCWQRQFGGNPSALGQTLTINSAPAVVIGVTPPGFYGVEPGRPIDLVVPITAILPAFYDDMPDILRSPRHWGFRVMGRLKPGVTDEEAQTETEALVRQALPVNPGQDERYDLTGVLVNAGGQGLDALRRNYARPLWLLMGIAGAILLIACANIAGLLLTRATSRQREISIRLAVGAGRARLVRQLLTESFLLACVGGGLGIGLAFVVRDRLLPLLNLEQEPLEVTLGLNLWLLAFSIGLCLAVGVMCGILPALRATRANVAPMLARTVPGGSAGGSRLFAGKTLIALQVALSVVLLVGAGLFARTLVNLRSEALGFRPEHVLLFDVDAALSGYEDARLLDFYERTLERVMALPGVRSASLSQYALLEGGWTSDSIVIPGAPKEQDEIHVHLLHIAPHYFETMGIPLLLGRDFRASDRENAPRVALVNQALARKLPGGGSPVGRRILYGQDPAVRDTEIIGMTADARFATLREPAPPTLYLPYRQRPRDRMVFAVRAAGDPGALAPTIRRTLAELDRNVPLVDVMTQNEQINRSVRQERTFARLVSGFALLAVVLACLGIYGTLAYSVARRTSEIGLRMALGARPWNIIRLVLRESLIPVLMGAALGLAGAVASTRLIESMLFGLTPHDPPTFLAATLALVGSALVAAWLPSRRAARIDPMSALRCE
jgi:predicted permease